MSKKFIDQHEDGLDHSSSETLLDFPSYSVFELLMMTSSQSAQVIPESYPGAHMNGPAAHRLVSTDERIRKVFISFNYYPLARLHHSGFDKLRSSSLQEDAPLLVKTVVI
jgi:hypothetical protein